MLKISVIGIGGISRAHIAAWTAMEDAEIISICDIRPGQMERYPDLNKFTDYDEMINAAKPDILDICLPTYLHPEYAEKAMKAGMNVLCEKPVSLHPGDAERLYKIAEENNVKFMIAQVLRFWPEYELIKELYDTEKYGKLLSGTMSRLGSYPSWSWDGWMMDESRSGLVPFDLHIHDLDFIIYAFGAPKKSHCFRSKRPEQDYLNIVYEYDGFFLNAEASWYASPYPFCMKFKFQFENAVVACEGGKTTLYERGEKIIALNAQSEGETGEISLPQTDAYATEIRYFADCVIANKPADKVKPDELETVLNILNNL